LVKVPKGSRDRQLWARGREREWAEHGEAPRGTLRPDPSLGGVRICPGFGPRCDPTSPLKSGL